MSREKVGQWSPYGHAPEPFTLDTLKFERLILYPRRIGVPYKKSQLPSSCRLEQKSVVANGTNEGKFGEVMAGSRHD